METKTLQLQNNRQLGYREYGNPKGVPIFYFPGMPCLTLLPFLPPGIIDELNIRVIALERPGYNVSSFQPDRRLLDWPDDVVEVADFLKINHFGVMGFSGGGPYAAMCAYKIPDRLALTIILSSIAPYDAFGIPSQLPSDEQLESQAQSAAQKYLDPDAIVETFLSIEPELAHDFIRSDELRTWIVAVSKETFRNGTEGWVHDAKLLLTQSWGFALEDISAKVQVWHGEMDRTLAHGQYISDHISDSEFHVMPGAGHALLPNQFGKILRVFREAYDNA